MSDADWSVGMNGDCEREPEGDLRMAHITVVNLLSEVHDYLQVPLDTADEIAYNDTLAQMIYAVTADRLLAGNVIHELCVAVLKTADPELLDRMLTTVRDGLLRGT